jgi:hypothetical protein
MTDPPDRLSILGHYRATERRGMTAQLVGELELPLLQTIGMERLDAIAAVPALVGPDGHGLLRHGAQ